ncbi:hypothetical protein [Rossellomorea aquimaris]|nr:hypothetical protein [Rossellomorea aquimaris]
MEQMIQYGNIILIILTVIVVTFLFRWGKEEGQSTLKLFMYFLVSCAIIPVYASYTRDKGDFELWVPAGFIAVVMYLVIRNKQQPLKYKASLLGLAVAGVLLLRQYNILPF